MAAGLTATGSLTEMNRTGYGNTVSKYKAQSSYGDIYIDAFFLEIYVLQKPPLPLRLIITCHCSVVYERFEKISKIH